MRNEFSSSPLEGLPRTIIIAGILLAVAIVVGAAPPWLSGAAATAVLVGSFVMNREATWKTFRRRQTVRHLMPNFREGPLQGPPSRHFLDAAE